MKVKRVIFVLLAVVVLAICGCNKKNKPTALKRESSEVVTIHRQYDMGVIKTQGNFSYIPINIGDIPPREMAPDILGLLDSFEKQHPGLEIISWSIDAVQDNEGFAGHTPHVYGIWVTHRKKK
jgi:uncharacterized lipoprotein NlpE involved in copper resistance